MNMKAITVKQPWASLIVHGIKDIENRTWRTNFRGRALIHAAGSRGKKFKIDLTDDQMKFAFPVVTKECMFGNFPFGAIIGSVEIMDCVVNHPSIWAEKTEEYTIGINPRVHERITGRKVIYNWVLANPVLFPESIPCKGKLSLWEYPNIQIPELDENGHGVCTCSMNVKEESQVVRMVDYFECRYCGGRWYK